MTNRSITTDIEINGYYFVSTDGVFYRGCTRCGGTGHYSFNGYDSICSKCNNVFELRLGTYIGTREDAEKDATKREKARLAREAKREQERLKLVAKQDAKVAAARAAYPGVIEFLESLDVYEERSSFITSMIENVTFVSNHDKPFTENMAKAVQREMEKRVARQAEIAATEPVPAGRQVVTGEIVGTKIVEGDYGTAYKITVKDDRGFRIYVSLPKAQADEAYDQWFAEHPEPYTYGPACWFLGIDGHDDDHGIKGRRITFTATLEQSRDDASFGFGSRPTKGSWI
jgi:hypothetical protein